MTNSRDIERALSFVGSHDREKWVRMGAAIKTELGEAGYDIWDQWSQSAENYDPKASKAVWKSLRPGFVGIGTLFYEARQSGYKPEQPFVAPDPEVVQAREAQRKALEEKAEAERVQAAKRAQAKAKRLWSVASPASPKHPYLESKGITDPDVIGLLRQDRYLNLLVPVKQDKELVAVQRISPDGTKFFGKGSVISGSAFLIGDATQAKERGLVLTEGLATGASIYQATGQPVLVVFAAHNLVTVAEKIKQLEAPIIVAADNDQSETGIKFARKAQAILGEKARVVMPEFDAQSIAAYQQRHGKSHYPSDFNDLHELLGLNVLRPFFHIEMKKEHRQEKEQMDKPAINTIEVDLERQHTTVLTQKPMTESQKESGFQTEEVWLKPPSSEVDQEEKEPFISDQEAITDLKYKAPPKSIESKYVYAEGKYYDPTGSTVLFDDKGKALATTRLDRQTVYDMIEVAKEKQWNAVILKGSPDFRRFAYLEAESQGIHTRGYTPTPADLKLVEQLREERALNQIEKDPERESVKEERAAAVAEAEKVQSQNQMPTAAQIETSEKADRDSDVPLTEITSNASIPSEVKVATDKLKQTETTWSSAHLAAMQYYKNVAKQAVHYMRIENRADAQRNFENHMDKVLSGTDFTMPLPIQAKNTPSQEVSARTPDNYELEIER